MATCEHDGQDIPRGQEVLAYVGLFGRRERREAAFHPDHEKLYHALKPKEDAEVQRDKPMDFEPVAIDVKVGG